MPTFAIKYSTRTIPTCCLLGPNIAIVVTVNLEMTYKVFEISERRQFKASFIDVSPCWWPRVVSKKGLVWTYSQMPIFTYFSVWHCSLSCKINNLLRFEETTPTYFNCGALTGSCWYFLNLKICVTHGSIIFIDWLWYLKSNHK